MIKIVKADYQGDFKIRLTFSDELEGVFDLGDYLRTHRGPMLEPLHDENYARNYYIETGALCWENELELSPEMMHDKCLLPGAA